MDKNKVDIDDTNISLDLSDATQAVKENRFQDAIFLLKRILKDQPDNIDALYLAAVSTRFLKKFDESKSLLMDIVFTLYDFSFFENLSRMIFAFL